MNAQVFRLQFGTPPGPFQTIAAPAKESWNPQPRRGSVVASRFVVLWEGRWRRVYSDHATARRHAPHFVNIAGERVIVSGVTP